MIKMFVKEWQTNITTNQTFSVQNLHTLLKFFDHFMKIAMHVSVFVFHVTAAFLVAATEDANKKMSIKWACSRKFLKNMAKAVLTQLVMLQENFTF